MRRLTLVMMLAGGCVSVAVGCPNSDRPKPQTETGLFGPSAEEMVAMAFDADDSDRRREGIVLLSARDWGLREPYLKGYGALLATDTDPRVRSAAVRALGQAKDDGYLPDVIKALDDSDTQVRRDAAAALDRLTGADAIEPLRRRATEDTSPEVRAACAVSLRHYPRLEVVQTLIKLLDDRSLGVRYRARRSLTRIVGRDYGYDPAEWSGVVESMETDKER